TKPAEKKRLSSIDKATPSFVECGRLKAQQNDVWLTAKGGLVDGAQQFRQPVQDSTTRRSPAANQPNGRNFMSRMKTFVAGLGLATFLSTGAVFAGDAESCKTVRLSDVGWTDIQATTG